MMIMMMMMIHFHGDTEFFDIVAGVLQGDALTYTSL